MKLTSSKLKIIMMTLFVLAVFSIASAAVKKPVPVASLTTGAPPPAAVSQSVVNSSRNWAGYVADNGTFTSVSGTWTVPAINSASNPTFSSDATWIGIGGVTSQDLIQAGTMAISDNSGLVSYQGWYEKLPGSSRQISLQINPGDSVSVDINKQNGMLWKIVFKNNTTGKSATITTSYNSSLSSAEWIEEMPSLGIRYAFIPLDNFGTLNFTHGLTVKNGQSMTIAQADGQMTTMINGVGQTLATPSTLASTGSSFSITRTNNPSTVAIARRIRRYYTIN